MLVGPHTPLHPTNRVETVDFVDTLPKLLSNTFVFTRPDVMHISPSKADRMLDFPEPTLPQMATRNKNI